MSIWKGFKKAVVMKKVKENEFIYSFYIKLREGDLPDYLPGQFISIRVPFADGSYSKVRQYTISSIANGIYYRVSIKREEDGEVSVLLCDNVNTGDEVEISAPVGKFFLHEGQTSIALIGGGIGITPMLTMAMEAAKSHRPTHFIYGLPNSSFMAFRDEIKQIAANNDQMKVTIAYSRPLETDRLGVDYDCMGRLSKEWLKGNINIDSEAYICGPIPFMKTVYQGLIQNGFTEDKIYYEMFQPGVDIRK